jgi:hypothetical protein
MSFEEFDQQINDVSEKHHPTYHEDAWGKMQQLLDEHLPVTRERKRRGWVLLPLLLLIITGGYFILNARAKQQGIAVKPNANRVVDGRNAVNTPAPATREANDISGTIVAQTNTGKDAVQTAPATITGNNNPVLTGTGESNNAIKKERNATVNIEPTAKKGKPKVNNNHESNIAATRFHKRSTVKTVTEDNDEDDGDIVPPSTEMNTTPEITTPGLPNPPYQQPLIATEETKPVAITAGDVSAIAKKEPVLQKKKKHRPAHAIALTIHAGTDISAIRFSEPGKRRTITGVGIQYQVNRRFTLRSGFFKTNKVYTAQPGDYTPPATYTPWGYKLQSVDGDCRVYEFPASISYTINPGKKLNLFVAAGVTSIIMKKEDYQYHYKSNYGQYKGYHYGIENKNDHLFSSADISVGVEKKLGQLLFFRAEPYLRLPLKSVGYGNIRLKSAGFMLTAGIKPFSKK